MILIDGRRAKTLPGVSAFGFITAALVVALFIVVAVIFAVGANKPEYEKPAEDMSTIDDLSAENKQILGLGDTKQLEKKEAEQKAEEDAKTENYKRYEQLSDEEKAQVEVIPTQYIVEEEIEENDGGLPSKFDLRDLIEIPIKDQATHGLCWDFAALRSVETNLALRTGESRDFSEMHVNYVMSSSLIGARAIEKGDRYEGGSFDLFVNYANYTSLVDEEQVPYEDYDEEQYSKFLDMGSDTRVTSVRKFNTAVDDFDQQILDVKNHIMEYGSVVTSINSDALRMVKNGRNNWQEAALFCPNNSYLCSFTTHSISIIGWDDDFSKDYFSAAEKDGKSILPSQNGAWIALNSWGENEQVIYISYDDHVVLTELSGVVSTDPKDGIKLNDLVTSDILRNALVDKYRNIGYEYEGEKYIVSINGGKIYDVASLDLSNINITDNDLYSIVADLNKMPNVSYIDLSGNNITDLSILRDLFNERHMSINLEGNQISDLSPLEGLTVSDLRLANNPLNTPIDISSMTVFGTVDISGTWALEEGQIIKLPKNATVLKLDNTGISSLAQIVTNEESENSIVNLSLRGNYLESLDGIEKFGDVHNLDISENPINDYSGIADVFNDETTMNTTLIAENLNLTSLAALNGIRVGTLRLANNNISNFDNFNCETVSQLNISHNQGITGFSKCSNLSFLNVESIGLNDLSEILKLNRLLSLSIGGKNYIDDYQELDKLTDLKILSIAGDHTINSLPRGVVNLNLTDTGLNNETKFDNLLALRSVNLANNPELTDYDNIYELIKASKEQSPQYFMFTILGGENVPFEDYEKIKDISEDIYFRESMIVMPVEATNSEVEIEWGDPLKKIGLSTMLWSGNTSLDGGFFTKNADKLVFTKPEVLLKQAYDQGYRIIKN